MARRAVAAPPKQIATALAAREMGASLREAAAVAELSDTAVMRYEHGQRPRAVEPVTRELVATVKSELLHEWQGDFRRLGEALTREKMQAMGGYQLVIARAIATDKLLAVMGQPALIVQVDQELVLEDGQVRELVSQIAERVLARRPEEPPAIEGEVIDGEPEASPSGAGSEGITRAAEEEYTDRGGVEGEVRGKEHTDDAR